MGFVVTMIFHVVPNCWLVVANFDSDGFLQILLRSIATIWSYSYSGSEDECLSSAAIIVVHLQVSYLPLLQANFHFLINEVDQNWDALLRNANYCKFDGGLH